MSEKVVLPKFDIPGQGPHPAVKALIGVGILFVVAVLGLGGALWRHHSQQVAAEEHAQAVLAARAAEAVAKAAAAKAAAEQAKAAAALAKAGASEGDGTAADAPAHRAHHHAKPAKGKAVAKGGDDKKASGGSKRDDAAIDKLLASFK